MNVYTTNIKNEEITLRIMDRTRVFKKDEEVRECNYTKAYPNVFKLIARIKGYGINLAKAKRIEDIDSLEKSEKLEPAKEVKEIKEIKEIKEDKKAPKVPKETKTTKEIKEIKEDKKTTKTTKKDK